MMSYEYFSIAAPRQTKRKKGENSAAEHLASVMTELMNEYAAQGWEYMRSETLSVEDKRHRFAKTEERVETVLVFRRPMGGSAQSAEYHQGEIDRSEVKMSVYESDPEPPRDQAAPAETAPQAEGENKTIDRSSIPLLGGARRD